MGDVTIAPMGQAEARRLTAEVREDAARLWTKLLELYEGKAHLAMGYRSWGAYYSAEFGESEGRGDQLLRAGRVLEVLEPVGFRGPGDSGSPLLSERAARELAPVLRNGADAVQEAYREAVEEHGEQPTAAQVREVVKRRRDTIGIPDAPVPDWVESVRMLSIELSSLADLKGKPDVFGFAERALDLWDEVRAVLERVLKEAAE
jgi:hypothetical protein